VSGLTNFSINGQTGASVTASQLGGFSNLGFILRADNAAQINRTITLGNLLLNGSTLGGPISSNNATSYFSLSSPLSISDFASGFNLTGDITMAWTGSAPNSRIEARIQGAGLAPVAAIPEPATWAMMIMGFGVVGSAMRRSRKVSTRIRFA